MSMHWNHRVVSQVEVDGTEVFSIAEVSYEEGEPAGWTTAEAQATSILDLMVETHRMAQACAKPVLDFIDGRLVERAEGATPKDPS